MVEPRVLVLGAGGPAAENFIKSLRAAYPNAFVAGADVNPWLLELSSADETAELETVPGAGKGDDEHAKEISLLVDWYDITMIHAQPDEEVAYLADTDWESKTFLPDPGVVSLCQDKLRCAEMLGEFAPASSAWVNTNGTRNHWHDVDMQNGGPIGDARWMRARTGAGSLAAKRVDSFKDALAWETVWNGRVAPEDFMLAEVLPGRDVSYTGVWWRGAPVAAACRERVEYADTRTPSGQSSSPRVARICSDEPVFEIAEAAIRRANETCGAEPHGVFYVDMREDAEGDARVTEINAGRFNTTQNFYTEAGLNLVDVYVTLHYATGLLENYQRLQRHTDEAYWVRQPDMGHKLVTRSKVIA